jgi:hypothetical protein
MNFKKVSIFMSFFLGGTLGWVQLCMCLKINPRIKTWITLWPDSSSWIRPSSALARVMLGASKCPLKFDTSHAIFRTLEARCWSQANDLH